MHDTVIVFHARNRLSPIVVDMVPAQDVSGSLRAHPTIPRRRASAQRPKSNWAGLAIAVVATALVLAPLFTLITPFVSPSFTNRNTPSGQLSIILAIVYKLRGDAAQWLSNSTLVTLSTVVVALLVGAPAGYVIARARARLVSVYSIVIFAMQSLPVILFVIPLFILFAGIGLVDNLFGLTVIYVGITISVAIWMMSAYIDSIPIELEEAAWLDGCSVRAGFFRVVLRNCLPGLLSTGIFTFVTAWNEYLIALVFLKSPSNLTLPIGLQMGRSPGLTLVILIPPLLIFLVFNRYFSLGGISGSLAGR
jgi:multiple sugar transport system permease protein